MTVFAISIAIFILWYWYYKKITTSNISFRDSLRISGLPLVKINVEDEDYYVVIDTGADINLIYGKPAKFIKIESENKQSITGVHGEKVVDSGMLNFSIQGKTYNEEFIFDESTPYLYHCDKNNYTIYGVIGTTFLSKRKAIINFDNNTIKYENKK